MFLKQLGGWFVCFFASLPILTAQDSQVPAAAEGGHIQSVIVYRDRALVTREIDIPDGTKNRTVSIPDLPGAIIPESVNAVAGDDVVIRAVRVSPKVSVEANREDIRQLDRRIEELQQKTGDIKQQLDGVKWDLATLEKMVAFSTSLASFDLQRGVLDSKTLIELTDFSMSRRNELAGNRRAMQIEADGVARDLEQALEERAIAAEGSQTTAYEATIFVDVTGSGNRVAKLSYLVSNCGWTPQYSLRGTTVDSSIELEYSALVHQLSGEDWNDIALTLSTASPGTNAARPGLIPLRVTAASPDELDEYENTIEDSLGESLVDGNSQMVARLVETLQDAQSEVEGDLQSGSGLESHEERESALNGLAGLMQEIELQAAASSWRTLAPDLNTEFSSQVYQLGQEVSLDSRRENQLVHIMTTNVSAEFYHVATPLLGTFAFREALATNSQPLGLLEGPANVYLDDQFVGQMTLPTTASGQKMTIGFGADQQVRTRRELVDKVEELKGGNRQLKFEYRLVLSNFKDSPIKIRLIDRMPGTQQSSQLSVALSSTALPISEDPLYVRVERPTGMLRWDLEVPAERHGSDAFDVIYGFTIEFDRNRVPTMQGALSELQAEFDAKFRSHGGFGGGGLGGGVFDIRD